MIRFIFGAQDGWHTAACGAHIVTGRGAVPMKLRQSIRDTLHFFTCGAERWLAVFFLVYPLYAEQVACAGLSLPLTAEKALLALALGAGITGPNLAKRIVEVFLNTEFEGGRHARRVGQLDGIQP